MDKMNIFDKDMDKYSIMNNILGGNLILTEKEQLLMKLNHVCGEIAENVIACDSRDTIEVLPFIESNGCSVRIIVGVYKPIDIHIVSENMFCANSLLFTEDFKSKGVANANNIVSALNNMFKSSNFMLDIDTNEN